MLLGCLGSADWVEFVLWGNSAVDLSPDDSATTPLGWPDRKIALD